MNKEFLAVNPHQELWSEWKEHLDWMLENHPARVKELFQSGKLKEYLDRKAALALKMICGLNDKGKSMEEAREVASQYILSPPDGPAFRDNPPEPLPEKLEAEIMKWAENLPENDPPVEIWV